MFSASMCSQFDPEPSCETENKSHTPLPLNKFSGAQIKLDDLFTQWILQKEVWFTLKGTKIKRLFADLTSKFIE